MELNLKDVSLLMMTPEKEIQQLVKKKEIPFQVHYDKIGFNKHQIIEWALGRGMPINISGHDKLTEYRIEALGLLLDKNSFHYSCDFTESAYIEQMISMIKFNKHIDRDIIIQLLKSREAMMSTAIGNGLSLPHPRVPLMIGRNKPLIHFFFSQNPLKLKSIDGKPVHTLILLISQTIKQHLSLLAHLSFLLSNETFRFSLENRLEYQEIMDIIKTIEGKRTEVR